MRVETDQTNGKTLPCALCFVAGRALALRRKMIRALVVSLALNFVPAGLAQQTQVFPPTSKQAVTDEYYGIKLTDDYRWLEDFNDPAVRHWADKQNRFSRSPIRNSRKPRQSSLKAT